jgi:hypothetical protein
MILLIGHNKVNACLRCHGTNILAAFPVICCKDCSAIMSFETNGLPKEGLKCVKFPTKSCYVTIMCLENKTYVDEYQLNIALPFDISDEKLKTYLIFS